MGRTTFKVQWCSKPKNDVRVRLRKDEHGFCLFDVRKNDVRVCSVNNGLVDLVKAF